MHTVMQDLVHQQEEQAGGKANTAFKIGMGFLRVRYTLTDQKVSQEKGIEKYYTWRLMKGSL